MQENMRVLTLVSMMVLASGCTTFNQVSLDSENDQFPELRIGDVVKVETHSGQNFTLKLRGIDDSYLYDADNKVAKGEIAKIEKKELALFGKVVVNTSAVIAVLAMIYVVNEIVFAGVAAATGL